MASPPPRKRLKWPAESSWQKKPDAVRSSYQCLGDVSVSRQCTRGGGLFRSHQPGAPSTLPRYDQAISKRVILASTVPEMDGATQQLIASMRGLQQLAASSRLVQSKATIDGLLGFDCEWRPQFEKGSVQVPALLQLASDTVCILIRLRCLGKSQSIPENLKRLLASEKVLKIGVGASEDATLLKRFHKLDVRGILELSPLAISLGIDAKNHMHSLRQLTEKCLRCHLSKSAQMSNWEVGRLSESQVIYAANDALVSVDIFRLLEEKIKTLIGADSFQSVVYLLTDVRLAGKHAMYLLSLGATLSQPRVDVRQLLEKEWVECGVHIAEYSPPTELTCLVNSSGRTICTCVQAHADWCTAQNIGDEVEIDGGEVVIRLREDAPVVVDATLEGACASLRSHQCVVCGSQMKLRHGHILPEPYWRCVTKVAKDPAHHDELLFCPTCYYFKNLNDWHRVKPMLSRYGLPLPTWPFHQLVPVNPGLHHEQSPIQLQSTDGSALVSRICKTAEDIHTFCYQWRKIFMEGMKPLCLPPGWSETYRYSVKLSSESTKVTFRQH